MPKKRVNGLGERHVKILKTLQRFHDENGFPPTIREIGSQIGIPSTSLVNHYLKQLERDGYIERESRVSRGIRIMKPLDSQEYPASPLLSVPLLGRIAAGTPVHIPASDVSYYDEESRIDIPVSLIAAKDLSNGLYALEVEGDSMIDAMVYEGDIVILRPEEQVNNGEMVVAWLKDEETTTLKYFYRENDQVRLQPANPDYDPIFINGDALEIQGKVVMVIRSLNRRPL